MHATRLAAAFLACLTLAAPAFGQTGPTEGVGLTWGATHAGVLRVYPNAECFAERTELSDWRCVLNDTTVNAISVDVVLYGYSTGSALGLAGVVFGFDSADVHGVVDTLAARYGRWSQVVERDFITKAEKHFPSGIWLWHRPDVEIRVEQDRGTLGHGQATIMLRTGLTEFLDRERTWQKRDRDDAMEAAR